MAIKITYVDSPNHRRVAGVRFYCPACGEQRTANAEVEWMTREVFGFVVRCWDVSTTYTCESCGAKTHRPEGLPDAPPAAHRNAATRFLAVAIGGPVLIAFVLLKGLTVHGGSSSGAQASLAPLKARAAAAFAAHAARTADCDASMRAALAKALPNGLRGQKPSRTNTLTKAQLLALPTYPPGIDRSRWGWTSHGGIACVLDVSASATVTVKNGGPAYAYDIPEAEKHIVEFEKALAVFGTPEIFVTLDDQAIAVVTREGKVVATANRSTDDLLARR